MKLGLFYKLEGSQLGVGEKDAQRIRVGEVRHSFHFPVCHTLAKKCHITFCIAKNPPIKLTGLCGAKEARYPPKVTVASSSPATGIQFFCSS